MSCVGTNDVQLARLADAIAQRVGQQRFHVWFNNSTRMDLRQDALEIAVPNDFISEWIGKNFTLRNSCKLARSPCPNTIGGRTIDSGAADAHSAAAASAANLLRPYADTGCSASNSRRGA